MELGAHVSAAGGIDKAIDRAVGIGAETIQVFASSPRAWGVQADCGTTRRCRFREKAAAAGISATFLHGSYLVNIGGAPGACGQVGVVAYQSHGCGSAVGARGGGCPYFIRAVIRGVGF